MQEPLLHFDPPNNFFGLGTRKNILGAFIQKKIIIPAPIHSNAFVPLYKFETSWSFFCRLSRGFVAISGASNLRFSWNRSTHGLLTIVRAIYLVELSLLYLTFFKTILAALFRTISLPLLFLSSKPSFFDDHFTTANSDFSIFNQLFLLISR